jgi:hypothetical protein
VRRPPPIHTAQLRHSCAQNRAAPDTLFGGGAAASRHPIRGWMGRPPRAPCNPTPRAAIPELRPLRPTAPRQGRSSRCHGPSTQATPSQTNIIRITPQTAPPPRRPPVITAPDRGHERRSGRRTGPRGRPGRLQPKPANPAVQHWDAQRPKGM